MCIRDRQREAEAERLRLEREAELMERCRVEAEQKEAERVRRAEVAKGDLAELVRQRKALEAAVDQQARRLQET